jgi:hypothetical protein
MAANNIIPPAYASGLLGQISEFSGAVSLVPIHAYLPIPPLTLIHAIVVSHNSLLITGYFTHNKGKINLATSIFFNQLLLFGPLSIIAAMLGEPCPLLIAPEFIYIYAGLHIFNVLTGLGTILIGISQTSGLGFLLDTLFVSVDAFARVDGIAVLGVEVVRNHANPIVSNSPFAALLIGTGVGVGSLLMLGLISFESTEWNLRTPLWLKNPSLLIGPDYISSFLATLAYYVLTSSRGLAALANPSSVAPVLDVLHPYVLPILPYAAAITSGVIETLQIQSVPAATTSKETSILTSGPILSPAEARALGAAIVFAFSFGNRLNRALLSTVSSTGPTPKIEANGSRKTTDSLLEIDGDSAITVKATGRKSTGAKKRK